MRILIDSGNLEAGKNGDGVPDRLSVQCCTSDDASCCASFYDRADVRYLLGDSWHPGGINLTLKMAEHLGLNSGQYILDVACGQATSLKAISQAWPVKTVGLDVGISRSEGTGPGETDIRLGDAHDIPFDDHHFDALLCECALSTFVDQPLALSEMRRVLKPGGRLALSDMIVEGEIPESLHDWVHVGTCLAGALNSDGYISSLENEGFRIVDSWNASDALLEMIGRIKRNLLGFALGKASGNIPDNVNLNVREGRRLLNDARQAIRDGVIGYSVYIAERLN